MQVEDIVKQTRVNGVVVKLIKRDNISYSVETITSETNSVFEEIALTKDQRNQLSYIQGQKGQEDVEHEVGEQVKKKAKEYFDKQVNKYKL